MTVTVIWCHVTCKCTLNSVNHSCMPASQHACPHTHAWTINKPHLPYKTGLDVMQSHPLRRARFGQYMHTHTHMHAHIHTRTHTHARKHAQHLCMHSHIQLHMHSFPGLGTCTHAYTHIHDCTEPNRYSNLHRSPIVAFHVNFVCFFLFFNPLPRFVVPPLSLHLPLFLLSTLSFLPI